MSGHPYQVYVPGLMDVQPGASGTFEVVNTGTKPITIHDVLGRYSTPAIRFPAADRATTTTMSGPWLSVWPSKFTLAPGQAERVHIKASVPHGVQGSHYLSIAWLMVPAHSAGGGSVRASGGPATLVRVPLPGTATPVTSATAPPRAPHAHAAGHGPDPLTVAGIALTVVAAMAVAVIALAMRGRRRGRIT